MPALTFADEGPQAFNAHGKFHSGARICRKEPFAHGDVKHSPEHPELVPSALWQLVGTEAHRAARTASLK